MRHKLISIYDTEHTEYLHMRGGREDFLLLSFYLSKRKAKCPHQNVSLRNDFRKRKICPYFPLDKHAYISVDF
jgi:hypothetical protein